MTMDFIQVDQDKCTRCGICAAVCPGIISMGAHGPQAIRNLCVRVNTVAPGFIEAKAAERLIQRLADHSGTNYDSAKQEMMHSFGGIPLGRSGVPKKLPN